MKLTLAAALLCAGTICAQANTLPESVAQSGVLRIANTPNYPPLEFRDPATNTLQGFDIDLGQAIAQKLGVKVEWTETAFSAMLAALDTGRVDVILSGMSDLPTRHETATFVDYLRSGPQFFVRHADAASYADVSAVCGKSVGASRRTSYPQEIAAWSDAHCAANPVKFVGTDGSADARTQLRQGRIDVAVQGNETLPYVMEQEPDTYHPIGQPISYQLMGIALPRQQTAFQQDVAAALDALIADGTYGTLLAKWNLGDNGIEKAQIMERIETLDDLPRRPPNMAPPAPHYPWPGDHKAAMFLSFDVDAESAWTAKDPDNYNRLVTMSYGGYEARVGTPKLLEMLDQLGLKATFFITGWTLDTHPAMCEAIQKAGHEIGHHGYHHLLPDPRSDRLIEEIEAGLDALKRRLGVVPKGYRAPSGEFCEELRVALADRGFVYTSSFRDDVRPYRHVLEDGRPGTIELPPTASYDDWMLGLSARFSPRPIFPKEHVLSIWKDELDESRDWGAMVTTVLHPQCSGRPMRLRLLREFLTYAQSFPDLWITTGEEIAANYLHHEQAGLK